MKCKTVLELAAAEPAKWPNGKIPAGTVIDDPEAWKLVRLGAAEPADAECERAAGMTQEQRERAQRAQLRAARGIHPDDFDAYDAGEMLGYNADGTWIPGPNAMDEAEESVDDDTPILWTPEEYDQ